MNQRIATTTLLLAIVFANGALAADDGKVPRGEFDLHYSIVGTGGPYIVILSGGPGEEVRSMQGVADELQKTSRCIMLEQRGTGRSKLKQYDASTINLNAYIEDIEALRKQLRVEKLALLGNSWGMMLALAYAGTHPDATRAVITIGSGPITRDYLEVMIANRDARLDDSAREVRAYWAEPAHHDRDPDRAEFERIRAMAPAYFFDRKAAIQYAAEMTPSDFNLRVGPAFLSAEPNLDLRPQLKAITAPVLLLQGRQDIAGEANICEAHELIRTSTLRFINQCGHMPWLEKPEQTWKIVNAFLDNVR